MILNIQVQKQKSDLWGILSFDDVLRLADYWNWIDRPIGYKGADGKTISKYSQTMVKPKNHRFVSYASVLRVFP